MRDPLRRDERRAAHAIEALDCIVLPSVDAEM
jgi:hypothetical protein